MSNLSIREALETCFSEGKILNSRQLKGGMSANLWLIEWITPSKSHKVVLRQFAHPEGERS